VMTPSRTVMIEMTMATIGRLMKKFDMAYLPSAFPAGFASAGFPLPVSSGFAPG